jgi:hypothetical protein
MMLRMQVVEMKEKMVMAVVMVKVGEVVSVVLKIPQLCSKRNPPQLLVEYPGRPQHPWEEMRSSVLLLLLLLGLSSWQ